MSSGRKKGRYHPHQYLNPQLLSCRFQTSKQLNSLSEHPNLARKHKTRKYSKNNPSKPQKSSMSKNEHFEGKIFNSRCKENVPSKVKQMTLRRSKKLTCYTETKQRLLQRAHTEKRVGARGKTTQK